MANFFHEKITFFDFDHPQGIKWDQSWMKNANFGNVLWS